MSTLSRSLLLYVAPVLCGLYIPFGGQLYLSEVILLIALLLGIRRTSNQATPGPTPSTTLLPTHRRLAAWGALWVFGIVVSALANGSSLPATVRSLANAVVFLVLSLGLIYALNLIPHAERSKAAQILLGSTSCGIAVGGVLQPQAGALDDPWKFIWGPALTLLLSAILLRSRRGARVSSALLYTLAAVHLFFDYRSLALICFIAATWGLLQTESGGEPTPSGRVTQVGRTRSGALVRITLMLVSALIFASLYQSAVQSGFLGQKAQDKLTSQTSATGGITSVLLGGRKEYFFYYEALLNNPVLGLGPESIVDQGLQSRALGLAASNGYKLVSSDFRYFATGQPLRLHSYILGGWIEAGIPGLAFWLFITFELVRQLIRDARRLNAAEMTISMLVLWNLWFSPLGGQSRFLTAAALALIFTVTADRTRLTPGAPAGEGSYPRMEPSDHSFH